MSVRSCGYDHDELDQVVCYFMRTILHLQKSGVEDLPLENPLQGECREFLDKVMEIVLSAHPPEIARMLLEAEKDAACVGRPLSVQKALCFQMMKELALHIYYDEDFYSFLLYTENLWGNSATEYATLTFYPNLPEEIQQKFGVWDMLQRIPENMLRKDDF